jgi:septal ring-binding cell division protein DamX
LLLKGRLAEAAQGFAANLKAPKSAFSIQLLVACADETVEKAVQNVQAQELYILPVSFKGRNCYRLCWGIYESEDRANSASRSVPEYFRKGGATPKVLPASSLLP